MYDKTGVARDFIYTALGHKVIVHETITLTVYNSDTWHNMTHIHISSSGEQLTQRNKLCKISFIHKRQKPSIRSGKENRFLYGDDISSGEIHSGTCIHLITAESLSTATWHLKKLFRTNRHVATCKHTVCLR
jgi:hypothetical protein